MILVKTLVLRLTAWIYDNTWMWHLTVRENVIRFSRSTPFNREGPEMLYFSYCGIGEHA